MGGSQRRSYSAYSQLSRDYVILDVMSDLWYTITMSLSDATTRYNRTLFTAMDRVNSLVDATNTTDIHHTQKLRRELYTYVINNLITNIEVYRKPHIQGLLAVLQGIDEDGRF